MASPLVGRSSATWQGQMPIPSATPPCNIFIASCEYAQLLASFGEAKVRMYIDKHGADERLWPEVQKLNDEDKSRQKCFMQLLAETLLQEAKPSAGSDEVMS
jgi:hypothetical protein